ncbi:ABC transporter ATP-binding protein [Acinetobacter sp. 10FS3-1]|uniref:ABC transporter ATP-binding protein n=1 Tax=Acinetobacter sp. 10FS3-1 TaxID=2563897 RepID=UPI00157DF4C6|nr:ATP-binding cassette domain-containing protein [Acinetobacter sp. 10FS3-1]QKQ70382.1 ATP-binding cassette domain-containing protein [Acinetobacter sp. 10FS3-1]
MQIPTYLQNSLPPTGEKLSAGHLLSTLKNYPTANAKVVLEAVDIQKSFAHTKVLEHINLDLKAGEFVSFLGPSGCGKTTLLRIIAGLEQPDYGRIIKQHVDITHLNTARRKCGIVFQNYALFPNLTVAENIAFGLHKKQWTAAQIQTRITELLQLIELPEISDKYPNQLSGGQQQRVALARAIAPKPDILLLDEPLSALDALVRLNLRQKIRAIQQQLNLPAIMVTHDQEEALSISDRVAVMNKGLIEQLDTPHNIYYKPQTRFVAQFIGTMNFIQATAISTHSLKIAGQYELDHPSITFRAGEQLEIAFRPENIELALKPEERKGQFSLAVRILNMEFLGAKRRLFCELKQNDPQAAPVQLQIDIENQQLMNLADDMWLQIPTQALHVFDLQGIARC